MVKVLQKQISALPHQPGVYLFYDRAGRLLYAGKSGSLRARVQSYFRADFAVNNAAKQALVPLISRIKHRVTDSEIEALILEANLIKKLKPRFNRLMRDDKSYRWVAMTRETFPKVFITHEPKLLPATEPKKVGKTWPSGPERTLFLARKRAEFIGPFTEGRALKEALRALRRIFPYCTCLKPHKKPCLNSQLKLCPGYCCLKKELRIKNEELRYLINIKNLKAVLMGRKNALVKSLTEEMKAASKAKQFEKAASFRDQIRALASLVRHKNVIRAGFASAVLKPLKVQSRLLPFDPMALPRVEGYDISNIQGRFATASMVVFSLGEPSKAEYRKFKIRLRATPNDYAMLQETLLRRLKHPEWPLPQLFLIDGGAGQRSAAAAVLKARRLSLPVFSLAKREALLYTENLKPPAALNDLPPAWAHFFIRLRDEAHRFAVKYHRYLREKIA